MSSNGMESRPARQLAVFLRLAGCAVDAAGRALRFAPLATGLLFCEEESCGIGSDLTSGGLTPDVVMAGTLGDGAACQD